jgi:hypothetical protein
VDDHRAAELVVAGLDRKATYARLAEAVAADAATRGGSCGAGRVIAAEAHPLDDSRNIYGGPLL